MGHGAPARGTGQSREVQQNLGNSAQANRAPAEAGSDAATGSSRPLKIVFFPLGYVLAHISRCVEIGKELRARGHEVVYAGDDPAHPRSRMKLAAEAGFRVERVREPFHPYGWDRFVRHGWTASAVDLIRLNTWVPLQGIIEDQVELMREERPDLAVGDASISVSTAAYIAQTPAACIMNAYASHFLSPQSLFHLIIPMYDRFLLAPKRKRAYERFGVKPLDALSLLRSIPLISPDLPELYDPPSYFPHYHTVGPIWAEHPGPLPDWFGELEDGTPNVYVTMGSTGLLETFLRRTFRVLGKAPYRFIVTTGGQASEETVRSAPDNFRITRYAPGTEILKRSKALIFHGGNGTMYQALLAGVPMISLPSHLEQDVITRIAVSKGFCIRMKARRVSSQRLLENLQRIIEEPQYREAARRYSEPIRAANGVARAADVLEQWAREGKPAGSGLNGRHHPG
ncbi:MAG: hypothetical protein IT365_16780 [Candidatus Hydrogenedentes bacterium]|nr:hypothetical protein [Candidatus Hydrogenedentota bacterium]